MEYQLTSGILKKLILGEQDEELWSSGPILQLLSAKKVNSARDGHGADRYRLIVSDGEVYTQAMLATQLSNLVEEKVLDRNVVLRVDRLTCNSLTNKRLLIVLELSVLGTCEKIGDPEAMDMPGQGAGGTSTNAAVTPATASTTPAVKAPAAQASNGGLNIFPIEGLSPYTNKWTIRARVTQKSDIRQWSNARGEGKLFSATFMDDTGEIRGTAFNQQVDEYYEKLVVGKVYLISKARVNLAKKKFSNSSNEYELSLDRGTEIIESTDQNNLPTIKYSFVPIDKLQDIAENNTCDVIGIVTEASDVSEITSKTTNRNITKRELTIADQSNRSVRLTLWGKQAEQYAQDEPNTVIAFKGVKVGNFGGRSLSMITSSIMTASPDIPEAHALRGWYDAAGHTQKMESFSSTGMASGSSTFDRKMLRTLAEVRDLGLGMSDKPDDFSCRATIVHIKPDNISYPACPTCNKKVTEGSEGWRCEKCDKSYSEPTHRYIISLSVADYTFQSWFQGFNDVGDIVFGMPANQLVEIKERNEAEFNAVLHKANCQAYNFHVRARQDTYNDQTRVRHGISRMFKIDYKAEAAALRDVLRSDWAN